MIDTGEQADGHWTGCQEDKEVQRDGIVDRKTGGLKV
jgi:hypothetical protein